MKTITQYWWLWILLIMVIGAVRFCWKDFYHAYRWIQIKKYLLKYQDSVIIRKMIWYHCGFLTEYDGTRHKVSGQTHSLADVKKLVNGIKVRYFTRDIHREGYTSFNSTEHPRH